MLKEFLLSLENINRAWKTCSVWQGDAKCASKNYGFAYNVVVDL